MPRRSARLAAKLGLGLGEAVQPKVEAPPRRIRCYEITRAGKQCKLPSAFIDGLCVVHSKNRVSAKIFGKDMFTGEEKAVRSCLCA